MRFANVPFKSYGVLESVEVGSQIDEAVEQIRRLGYAVVDAGYSLEELAAISNAFHKIQAEYVNIYGAERLKVIGEDNTIRLPMALDFNVFGRLALNPVVLSVVKALISGKFLLNQQNGVINPARQEYGQGAWHRDLPYQHFTSSRPLAINALFCVDDFTLDNGGTYVLPASHLAEPFPSRAFVNRHAVQLEAKAGSFVVLDCMLFHSGGYNFTELPRRAVNHVYSVPYIRQQINVPLGLSGVELSEEQREILGFSYSMPSSIEEYLEGRRK